MATCYQIIRNVSLRSRNDDVICDIAGVYSNLEKAIEQAWPFKFFYLPDGNIRLYDRDKSKLDMERDTFGSESVGIIAEVR
jgi:hypothetical protein